MTIHGMDLHSHILPEADHGCRSVAEAAEQLKMMKDAGIDTVVATPHFYPASHSLPAFLKKAENGLSQILNIAPEERPRIVMGAEVLLYPGLHNLPDFERLCIHGTRTLMLELPFPDCNEEHLHEVEDILRGGYTVILAHIDRYLKHNAELIDALLEMGAWAQVNATALHGFFEKRRLMPYLRSGCVVGFGTDLHNTDRQAIRAYEALSNLPNGLFEAINQQAVTLLQNATRY